MDGLFCSLFILEVVFIDLVAGGCMMRNVACLDVDDSVVSTGQQMAGVAASFASLARFFLANPGKENSKSCDFFC